ncbi:MAG: hypothetical protein ACE5Q6_16030 [Dehalococcoidia bacterium]
MKIESLAGRLFPSFMSSLGPGYLLLALLAGILLIACNDREILGFGSSSLKVTLHQFQDQRPESDRFLASITLTNDAGKFPRTRRYQELACVLKDWRGEIVGYKQCGTAGLLPQESYSYDLEFVTLSYAPVEQLQVLDVNTDEPLASLDLRRGTQASADEVKYAKESYLGRSFESLEEWRRVVEDWEEQEPPSPGPLANIEGSRIGLSVSRQLDQHQDIENDKWKHCIVGAEIARTTSVKTAIYAGWLKEHQDLTDGLAGSQFDEADFEATRDGARQTEAIDDQDRRPFPDSPFPSLACDACPNICERRWGNPYLPWNGGFPPS